METEKLHSGLYGAKAKAIINICKKLRQGSLPLNRKDLYDWNKRILFQDEEIVLTYKDKSYNILTVCESLNDLQRANKLKHVRTNFFNDNCLQLVDLDQYDEVELLVKTDGYGKINKGAWIESFYTGLIFILDVFINDLKTALKMNSEDEFDIHYEQQLSAMDNALNFSIGYLKIRDEDIKLTLKDIEDMAYIAGQRQKTLRKDYTMWQPETKDDEDLFCLIGTPEADPFRICRNELLINERAAKLEKLLNAFDEEFKQYDLDCSKLKRVANEKILQRFGL